MRGFFARTGLPLAASMAMFALATVPNYALNPQPLPPRIAWPSAYAQVALNPQPLPPRELSLREY
jgi:hypothetical protein